MSLNVLPKISIITPSFNQGKYIEQCIQSVMNQGYVDFEHIVIDGGSTDETVSILEKYPHVMWVSEPDHGQADALNKGFSMASGSVFGWVNSDDFFAPNIFGDIVATLKDYPIVMGACELTEEDGTPKSRIHNKERTWFDLLKYWVPYSIPTQPSIFFTKAIADEVMRFDGNLFDAELHYCMDYDLWLRIAHLYPFSHRLDETLSYYRMTPDNKTSDAVEGMPYAEPEMSRIHRRYREIAFDTIYTTSLIIPFGGSVDQIASQLKLLTNQHLKNFETLVTLAADQISLKRELKKVIALHNEEIRKSGFGCFARLICSTQTGLGNICNDAVNLSEGSLVAVLAPNSSFSLSLLEIVNRFELDSLGILTAFPALIARKILLFEIDGFYGEAKSIDELIAKTCETARAVGWNTL